jgi:hypothetical protein
MSPLHDYNLANQTPASYRTDHNNLNLAIAGCNASSSGITTTYAHMLYADVSSSGWMRQRNAADSTFNYLYKTDAAGGVCTYAGSPSTNHIGRFVGQFVFDTSNTVYYYNTLAGTSSQATWSMVASSSAYNASGFPKGYIHGLIPTYASAASFTISAGGCRDSGNVADISISTAYTVNITVSGAGGLSTSETESTSGSWYYCFAMRKSGDGTVNFILTASSSGAVLPSGYDQTRMLPFAIRNTTQANFLRWSVIEGWPQRPYIKYDETHQDPGSAVGTCNLLDGGSASTYTAVTMTSFVPPISNIARILVGNTAATAQIEVSIRPTGQTYQMVHQTQPSQWHPTTVTNLSTSKQFDYAVGSGSVDIDIDGYYVTEL